MQGSSARGETQTLEYSIRADVALERRQVLELFNATQRDYPRGILVYQLFEAQVERTPDALALSYESCHLTYAGLNARANQLARYLRARHVGPDVLVGICTERSFEMVVGLLGILKAGGAYVPLDPGNPRERLEYMLTDCMPRVLLTQQRLLDRLPATQAMVVELDGHWERIAEHQCGNLDARQVDVRPSQLAYVIYTSGSTGRPKGAMNEHRGVVNRLQWMQERYGLSPDDRVLQKTPFSFDVSVWEFFWTLMTGACLVIAKPDGHRDPGYLRELIETTGVTTLHFVPSMLQVFVGDLRSARCRSLRHIVCSGEELSFSLQHRCFACLPQVRLSNLYGPTEAAVDVTAWECDPRDSGPRVPIGRPIANIQMYVLDCSGEPTPVGVAGELHIGGIGVGRGYLNRPELSAERFVKDPFSTDPGARLYKTGDLGRWRADGVLEYLGRNDHQVKIRGFRIELGEIEACLSHHPLVREAVVLAREDEPGEKRLVAYVVEQEGTDIAGPLSIATLKAYLKETLPEHMVPSAFVVLPSMPLTANGKLDRQALPIPGSGAFGTREFEPLQGDTEEAVARIWRTLLNVARVGRQDDFFELGGHSLLGNQMIEQTATLYGVDIPFIALFKYPTVALFARFIEGLRT